jgi:hypothetical protein
MPFVEKLASSIKYPLTVKQEAFALLLAQGLSHIDAYIQAYGRDPKAENRDTFHKSAWSLSQETSVRLRVQELRAPVIRKVRKKIEYGLQRALEQCDVAWDLAYEAGDAKTLLKAVEMQAKLAKLLTEEINVNHRHGLLDDASTEVLLLMKKEAEVRRARQKLLPQAITIEGEIVSESPQGAHLKP